MHCLCYGKVFQRLYTESSAKKPLVYFISQRSLHLDIMEKEMVKKIGLSHQTYWKYFGQGNVNSLFPRIGSYQEKCMEKTNNHGLLSASIFKRFLMLA
uniref:Uncharacterized protein n=1 Tax=Lepeophtheirus salmonis TaxID=72036 RepID=A0A0K2T0A7_LEPSM